MTLHLIKSPTDPNADSNEPPASLPMVKKGGCVVLLGRTHVVLVQPLDQSDKWLLPKGHLEDGEDPITAAHREAQEETGSIIHPLNAADFICTTERLVEATLKWPAEHEQVHWYVGRAAMVIPGKAEHRMGIFPALTALAKLSFEEHRKVLASVLAGEEV